MPRTRYELMHRGLTYPPQSRGRRPLWQALASGAAAGLAATWVMTQYQTQAPKATKKLSAIGSRLFGRQIGGQTQQPSGEQQDPTTTVVANKTWQKITGNELPPERKGFAGNVVHYGFGATVGALYGVLSESASWVRSGRGVAYGATVWAVADELMLPAAGLAKWWPDYPLEVHMKALSAHLVYGSALDAFMTVGSRLKTAVGPRLSAAGKTIVIERRRPRAGSRQTRAA